ncbi:PKD domain-containing protein [bacterium]|nr:PKD domain-containing protein [bacterium]
MKHAYIGLHIFLCLITITISSADTIHQTAQNTLTAVEMNHGDVLQYKKGNSDTFTMKIHDTDLQILLTDLKNTKKGHPGGGTVYQFTCDATVDGQPMTFKRYIPVQESFYEPYVINGVRIWFDGIKTIGEHFNQNHGACVPTKDARFALQDANRPICPQPLKPWYPNSENFVNVRESYNGDDVWMGTYFGADLHGGMDINMPIGTPLWAPIDFDDHYYFNSIARGHNNNRWRGIKQWPNGDLWTLQVHHLLELRVDEHTPIPQGKHYAAAAGELTGSHAHSHFVFKVGENEPLLLDPWILFWQIFENNKDRQGAIEANMPPFSPAETGQTIQFSSRGSRAGVMGNHLSYFWTFGDNGWSNQPNPSHVFVESGIYPVTLHVFDGLHHDEYTQHITVSGQPVEKPALALHAPAEYTFHPRSIETMDIYNRLPAFIPHTLQFTARPRSRPKPQAKRVVLHNGGTGTLKKANIRIAYHESADWLRVQHGGEGKKQELQVRVNAKNMKPKHGVYHATVYVDCPGALNSPQGFRVKLTTPRYRPKKEVIVDDRDAAFYATPYYWLAPRFHASWTQGYAGRYLMNGGQAKKNAFVRFQPDLAAGTYQVKFSNQTPFRPTKIVESDIGFYVVVHHKNGKEKIWIQPQKSRIIGQFAFEEGTDGYVDILADAAQGLVVADAVEFLPQTP